MLGYASGIIVTKKRKFCHEDQDNVMVNVMNLQYMIGGVGRDEEREDQFGNIWEGIRMENHISRQGTSLDL